MKKTEKKPSSKIEDEEVVEEDEEENAATLTQMALRTHAESASASTITQSFAEMMDDIQVFCEEGFSFELVLFVQSSFI